MLKKLLKYELKNIFKFLIIFYSLALFFGILTRIFLNVENSIIFNIIGQVCSGTAISMMFSILINNLMRIWVRFRQNLYGDESYLTHTLPIEKEKLYLSKIITTIITLFTSVLVIGVVVFIAYYSKENLETLKNMILPITTAYGSLFIKMLIALLFVLFLEFANMLQSGLSGIIIGHQKNNSKIGYSVLFGFVVYIIIQVFSILIIFLVSLFNSDLMNLFVTSEVVNINTFKLLIYLAILTYTITLFVGYFVNIKLFKKGVNVD